MSLMCINFNNKDEEFYEYCIYKYLSNILGKDNIIHKTKPEKYINDNISFKNENESKKDIVLHLRCVNNKDDLIRDYENILKSAVKNVGNKDKFDLDKFDTFSNKLYFHKFNIMNTKKIRDILGFTWFANYITKKHYIHNYTMKLPKLNIECDNINSEHNYDLYTDLNICSYHNNKTIHYIMDYTCPICGNKHGTKHDNKNYIQPIDLEKLFINNHFIGNDIKIQDSNGIGQHYKRKSLLIFNNTCRDKYDESNIIKKIWYCRHLVFNFSFYNILGVFGFFKMLLIIFSTLFFKILLLL